MSFKENFKKLREKNELTQEDVAKQIGISRQSISKWENGINEPDLETLEKLCAIFNCSLEELLLGKEIEKTEPINKNNRINSKKLKIGFASAGSAIALITLLVFSILLSVNIVKYNQYQYEMEHTGMSPEIGLKGSFPFSNLAEYAEILAINTYGEEVVANNPNLIESVKSVILGKYTLHGDTYYYNPVDDMDVKINYFYIIPISISSIGLIIGMIFLSRELKKE